MGLLSWFLKRKIVLSVEGTLEDGRTFKCNPHVEYDNVSEEQIRSAIINKIQVDNGVKIKTINFTGQYNQ